MVHCVKMAQINSVPEITTYYKWTEIYEFILKSRKDEYWLSANFMLPNMLLLRHKKILSIHKSAKEQKFFSCAFLVEHHLPFTAADFLQPYFLT